MIRADLPTPALKAKQREMLAALARTEPATARTLARTVYGDESDSHVKMALARLATLAERRLVQFGGLAQRPAGHRRGVVPSAWRLSTSSKCPLCGGPHSLSQCKGWRK